MCGAKIILCYYTISSFRGDKLYLDTNTFYLFLRALTPDMQWLFRKIQQGVFQAYLRPSLMPHVDRMKLGVVPWPTAVAAVRLGFIGHG